jgi:DHA1 family tetracycline resistance protein-like MFS transporter
MQFLASPVLGALSDRFGRRPVILISLAGYGVDYLLLALAPTLWWLVVARLIGGVTGASITTGAAYLADISSPEDRARNFGLIGAAFGLGFIAGPALGGLLGSVATRLPFYVAAAVVLLNVLYGVFVLPESLAPEHRRPFTWADLNPFRPMLALGRIPGLTGLVAAFFVAALAQRGLESVWVLYTEYRYGWLELQNGLALALVGVSAAVVQGGLMRRIVPALGERNTILAGFAIAALAQVGFGLAPAGWVILLVIPLSALGGVVGPTLQGVVSGAVSRSEQGAVQGALTSLVSLTAVAAPLLATGVFTRFSGRGAIAELPGAPFLLQAALCVLALALATWSLRRGLPARHVEAAAARAH